MTPPAERGLVLAFPECREQAAAVARAAGLGCAQITLHRFPDGESLVTLPEPVAPRVFIYRSLDQPNEKLLELLMAAATARDLGAARVGLVAPYLCYMRQDKAFHPGEAVSQRIVGELLAGSFDEVVTVDPHLHRVATLEQAVPVTTAVTVAASDAMARFLEQRLAAPILIGPDQESEQWVAAIARRNALQYGVARKQRLGDSEVRVTLPEVDYTGRNVVLVDDIASTGNTIAATCRALAAHRPASIRVMVTHALFAAGALERMLAAGADEVVSCDSIRHPSNRISLADSLARALRDLR